MKKICLLVCLVSFGGTLCKAQTYTPLELCKRILSRDTLPYIKKYCAGDFEGHPNGSDFAPHLKVSFTVLKQTDKTAVINVTLSDSTGNSLDTYFHLAKDSIWKVNAFRALAMTGMLQQMYDELKKMTPAQIDKIIAEPLRKGKDHRIFKSRDEYQYLLNNTELTLASDDKIVAHFQKNKEAFEQLKADLLTSPSVGKRNFIQALGAKNALSDKLKALYLHNAELDGEQTTNTVILNIGGIVDNYVGYMYIKDSKDVPEMSGDHFIMIRSIGDGWYLYKTT
ncbi:hypothetical protein [Mucilaginibacter gilvus]|uniref:Nuclear transport factor 2 family protein n=1 Tax=Mucilaginibacter gilvus TaxID=2305909 RepID=A0A3S3Z3H6_9SPHI|nr:hypothetical protein [Mucilaginibacter gilvus]RWY52264.1 hypothetical protein EPL05_10110 [Mucilaginibacter gilvus]